MSLKISVAAWQQFSYRVARLVFVQKVFIDSCESDQVTTINEEVSTWTATMDVGRRLSQTMTDFGRRISISSMRRSSNASITSIKNFILRRPSRQSFAGVGAADQIQAGLEERFNAEPERYDARDVTLIRRGEHVLTKMFLEECDDTVDPVGTVIETLDTALRWRKKTGVLDLKISDLPLDIFAATIVVLSLDKADSIVLYVRMNIYLKLPEWSEVGKHIITFLCEKTAVEKKKFILVLDCANVSTAQYDIGLLQFAADLVKYYPGGLQGVYAIDTPWMIKPLTWTLCKLLPEKYSKVIKVVDRKQLANDFGVEIVPDFMGGKLVVNVDTTGMSTLEELAEKRSMPDSELQKMRKHCDALIAKRKKK